MKSVMIENAANLTIKEFGDQDEFEYITIKKVRILCNQVCDHLILEKATEGDVAYCVQMICVAWQTDVVYEVEILGHFISLQVKSTETISSALSDVCNKEEYKKFRKLLSRAATIVASIENTVIKE